MRSPSTTAVRRTRSNSSTVSESVVAPPATAVTLACLREHLRDSDRRLLSHHLLDGVTGDGEIKPDARDSVMSELRRHFRPGFLNRIDDIVLFKPLTETEIEHIVELMFDDLRTRLADRRTTVTLSEATRRVIAEQGFDPVYGARPLRRFIAHEVEIRIDVLQDELQVSFEPGPPAVAA